MSVNYCEIPLARNPSGAPPNFVDPPSLIATVQAVGLTFSIVTLVLILLRLYVRFQNKNALGSDDGMSVILLTGLGKSCRLTKSKRSSLSPSFLLLATRALLPPVSTGTLQNENSWTHCFNSRTSHKTCMGPASMLSRCGIYQGRDNILCTIQTRQITNLIPERRKASWLLCSMALCYSLQRHLSSYFITAPLVLSDG
jgi:hypothetical protein